MIATLIAVIVANVDNVCFFHYDSFPDCEFRFWKSHTIRNSGLTFAEGYCLHQELSAAHGVVNDEFSGRPLVQ